MRIIFQGFTFIRQRLQKVIKSQCPLKSGCWLSLPLQKNFYDNFSKC
jgi:hypothetical protein